MSEKELEQSAVLEEASKATELLEGTLHNENDPVVSAKALLNVGAHFGHKVSRWNPKMQKYIFTHKQGIHIIDLSKTVLALQESYLALRDIVLKNGKVLFVGTKPAAVNVIKEEATRCGSFYVNNRWLGGTLTNFKTIYKRIRLLKELEQQQLNGVLDQLTKTNKKEANERIKILERLKSNLEGVKEIKKLPEAIVIVDQDWEHNAINEALKLKIPVFCLTDTNADPTGIDHVIPCNEDSEQSIRLIVGILADAVSEAKGGNCLYAYKDAAQVNQQMSELLKEVEKTDETRRAIRSKLRDDVFAIRKGGKKNAIRAAYAKKIAYEAQKAEELANAAKLEAEAQADAPKAEAVEQAVSAETK